MFSITLLSSYVRRRYFGFVIVLFLVEKHLLYITLAACLTPLAFMYWSILIRVKYGNFYIILE